jgi:hypothetical protein
MLRKITNETTFSEEYCRILRESQRRLALISEEDDKASLWNDYFLKLQLLQECINMNPSRRDHKENKNYSFVAPWIVGK